MADMPIARPGAAFPTQVRATGAGHDRHRRRSATARRPAGGLAFLLSVLVAGAASAGPRPLAVDGWQRLPAIDSGPGTSMRNCAGADQLSFGNDPRAMLDDHDRDRVQAAMLKQFPVLQRHGFGASAIIVWQRDRQDWLYVALAHEGEDPREACYTATFSAAVFDFTPVLLRKYFFASGPRS